MTQEILERIQKELQRRFRLAGIGSVSRVEAELDLATGYFRDQRRPGYRRIDLKVLFKTLEALDVEPADFFGAVFGPIDLEAAFRAEAAILAQRDTRRLRILAKSREEMAGPSPDFDLEALEDLMAESPQRAMRRASALVRRVETRRRPDLLVIYADCCRRTERFDDSHLVLARALELVGDDAEPAVRARIEVACAALLADSAQDPRALAFAEEAALGFVLAADEIGMGRALAVQGRCLERLERPREAVTVWRRALEFLPADSDRAAVLAERQACRRYLEALCERLGEAAQVGSV